MNGNQDSKTEAKRKPGLLYRFATGFVVFSHVVSLSVPAYVFYVMTDTQGRTDWIIPKLEDAKQIEGTLSGKS